LLWGLAADSWSKADVKYKMIADRGECLTSGGSTRNYHWSSRVQMLAATRFTG